MTSVAKGTPALGRLGKHAFLYEYCDIPPGMTVDEFRPQRVANRNRASRPALLNRLRSRQSADAPSGALAFPVRRSEKGH